MRRVIIFNDDFPKGIYKLLADKLDISFYFYNEMDEYGDVLSAARQKSDMIVLRDRREVECSCHRENSSDHTYDIVRRLRKVYRNDIAVWFGISCPHEYEEFFKAGADFVIEPTGFTSFLQGYARNETVSVYTDSGRFHKLQTPETATKTTA